MADLTLDQLLAQFQPTEQEKRQAQLQALTAAGFALMGTPRGREWQGLANAGFTGMSAMTQAQQLAQQQRAQQLAATGAAMTLAEKYRALKEQDAIASAYAGTSNAASIAPPAPSIQMGPPTPSGQGSMQPPVPLRAPYAAPSSDFSSAASITPPGAVLGAPGAAAPAGIDPYQFNISRAQQLDPLVRAGNQTAAKLQAQYIDQAAKLREEYSNPVTEIVNGVPVLRRYGKYGAAETVQGAQPLPKIQIEDLGGTRRAVDLNTLAPGTSFAKTISPGEAASNALGYAHLAETKRHNLLTEPNPDMVEPMAQGIASGQLPPLSNWALQKPEGQAIMSRVMQINPTYSAMDFKTQQATLQEFEKGKAANQVRSFNVGLAHLDTLQAAADAMNNKDTQLFNKAANIFKTQTGSPVVNNFNAVKEVVGNEIVKAIVGTGGGVGDREKAQKTVDAANSPAQLSGVIGQYKELMKGQLGGLKQQYEQGTGRKDFNRFLSQEALAVFGGDQGSAGWSVQRVPGQ